VAATCIRPFSWVMKAADVGHGLAWRFLGDLARDGLGGGPPDLTLAKKLYLHAHNCRDAVGPGPRYPSLYMTWQMLLAKSYNAMHIKHGECQMLRMT
jgi:hypothetical protein